MKWPRKGWGLPMWQIQEWLVRIVGDPGMVSGNKGALFGVPGFVNFMGEYFLIPAQGYGIHLSTRINFHCYALHSFFVGSIRHV